MTKIDQVRNKYRGLSNEVKDIKRDFSLCYIKWNKEF